MTNPTIDWARAVLVGAVAGGVFWALAAHTMMTSMGSTIAVVAICGAAIAAIAAGVIVYLSGGSTRTRSYGVGFVLAPLTGAAPLLAFCLGALLINLVS